MLALLALALTVALTFAVIKVSQDRGRLSIYPRADDVMYLARGAELVLGAQNGWASHGLPGAVRGLVHDWLRDPPHAPWATVSAAVGFGIFGYQEWAAYLATALPVLVFLLAAARVAQRAGGRWSWRSFALTAFAASAPFLGASIANLKPDYCAGILTAIGMLIALRAPVVSWCAPGSGRMSWLGPNAKRLAWIGAWFGLALLAKPAMMIPTVMLAGGTLAICTTRDLLLRGYWRGSGRLMIAILRPWLVVASVMLAVALPHFAIALRHAWEYTFSILAGSEAWRFPGTRTQHALYYLTGPGGRLMLGGARSLAPIGLLLALFAAVAAHGAVRPHPARRRLLYAGALLAALVMAWAGPTLSPVKGAQFAAAFSALWWLAGIHAAASLCRASRTTKPRGLRRPVVASALIGMLILIGVATFRWTFPLRPADKQDPVWGVVEARDVLVRDVYKAIRTEGARGGKSLAIAGSPSDMATALFKLWSIRDGISLRIDGVRLLPGSPPMDDDARAKARVTFSRFDLVLVNEGGAGLTKPMFASADVDEFFLGVARADPELELIAQVRGQVTGKLFELYRRKE